MNHEELIDETHPKYIEAREFIESHGVAPGPQGHTVDQLLWAIESREWSWELNQGNPQPERLGDYVGVRKTFGPLRGSGSHSISCWGHGGVVALTLALAAAIREDAYRCGQ